MIVMSARSEGARGIIISEVDQSSRAKSGHNTYNTDGTIDGVMMQEQ